MACYRHNDACPNCNCGTLIKKYDQVWKYRDNNGRVTPMVLPYLT